MGLAKVQPSSFAGTPKAFLNQILGVVGCSKCLTVAWCAGLPKLSEALGWPRGVCKFSTLNGKAKAVPSRPFQAIGCCTDEHLLRLHSGKGCQIWLRMLNEPTDCAALKP